MISKRDHVISHVLVRERFADLLPIGKRDAIREAFLEGFKKKNFDGGLMRARPGDRAIAGGRVGPDTRRHRAPAPVIHHRAAAEEAEAGRSTMGTFLLIIAGIFGVLLVLRLLGGLFGRSGGAGLCPAGAWECDGPGWAAARATTAGRLWRPGRRILLGLLGGLGGALAGNWLYDQFSGRHGNTARRMPRSRRLLGRSARPGR